MMVIRRGEQLQHALRLLQEVTEWSIAGQLARVNAGHLEEGEVARTGGRPPLTRQANGEFFESF